MKNVLVTGSAGFIGSHFVIELLNKKLCERAISLDSMTYAGDMTNLDPIKNHEGHYFVKGDIGDTNLVNQLLQEYHVDTVVHFAAESHVDRSITDPFAFVNTNVLGTVRLLDTCLKYKEAHPKIHFRFHHISTDEVFGSLQHEDPSFSEMTPFAPNSPYAASKASSDHFVRAYFQTYKFPATISNCSNNYGPHQHPEKFIPTVIRSCFQNKPIPVYGQGLNVRDWLYVTDHVDGILKVLEKGQLGETYNIGGDGELDNLSLAKKICQQVDGFFQKNGIQRSGPCEDLIQFVTDRKGHDFRYSINYSKIKNELNWKPLTSFEKGLQDTVAHYGKMFAVNILS